MAAHPSGKKKTTVAGVVIAILIGGYTMLRPQINEATGWNLPSISKHDTNRGGSGNSPSPTQVKPPSEAFAASNPDRGSGATGSSETGSGGPLADRMSSAQSSSKQAGSASAASDTSSASPGAAADSSLKYGLLQETSSNRYMSPAGLQYTPGSAEGHRLEHLKRHTADQPSRPGKHGVFDGGMEGALKSIDKAYENAKAEKRTTKQVDGNRTIYTVDMGKRVGYIGGREGNQRRKPMARRIRLVLEGNRVITAFPL
ncbi:hypothetical protein [Neorhodopirellula lusitana]|uniref:hypothetical protein n=1 Tax=Neorhodopirellula lusitana TaxID=445327 RepID=UPI00384EBA75